MRRGRIYFIILVLFSFMCLAVNLLVVGESRIVNKYDAGGNIRDCMRFSRLPLWTPDGMYSFLRLRGASHPRLYHAAAGPVFALCGRVGLRDVNKAVVLINYIFFLTLFFSVYGIGGFLYDRQTGLLAAIMLSLSPVIFGHARICMLDLPMAAAVSVSFLFLFYARNFSSLAFSLLAGIAFGVSQLIKEAALIFIIGSLVYYAAVSIASARGKDRVKRGRNICALLATFIVIAGPVYFNPLNPDILAKYLDKTFSIQHNAGDILYYLRCFPGMYFGILFFLALCPAIMMLAFDIGKINRFLIIWLVVPLAAFSLSPNKTARFLIPILPAAFLLLSSVISGKRFSKLRKPYTAVVLTAGIMQYLALSFLPGSEIPQFFKERGLYAWINGDLLESGIVSVYRDGNYVIVNELTGIFTGEPAPGARPKRAVVTFDYGIQDAVNCGLAARGVELFIECPQQADPSDAPRPGTVDWGIFLLSADYVIDKTGDPGRRGALEDIGGALKNAFDLNRRLYLEVGSVKLDNGDVISVYKRIRSDI
ncbi:MAG: glycosyltransferase family 39 protein [Candidatus Omnitrophota bacterium]